MHELFAQECGRHHRHRHGHAGRRENGLVGRALPGCGNEVLGGSRHHVGECEYISLRDFLQEPSVPDYVSLGGGGRPGRVGEIVARVSIAGYEARIVLQVANEVRCGLGHGPRQTWHCCVPISDCTHQGARPRRCSTEGSLACLEVDIRLHGTQSCSTAQ